MFVRSWEENRELHDRHIEVRTAHGGSRRGGRIRCRLRFEFDEIVDLDFGDAGFDFGDAGFADRRHSHCPTLRHGNGQLGPPNQERHRQAADGRFHPGQQSRDHIHQGSCAAQGDVLVPFPDVTANDVGAIDTTITSSQPSPDGLAAGTLLNIHLAPAAQLGAPGSLPYTPISCADINPAASTTLTMAPPPPPQPGQQPQGSAKLTYDPAQKRLAVDVTATGLVGDSDHAAHIHLGSCDSQGAVKYPLNDLKASPDGTAEATRSSRMSIRPHRPPAGTSTSTSDHPARSTKTAVPLYFQPIICGNIGP